MLRAASRLFGWQTSLLLLPILYVIYRSHHLYVKRLETSGGVVGVLSLYRRERAALTSDDLGRLISFGSRLARVLNRSEELVEARR